MQNKLLDVIFFTFNKIYIQNYGIKKRIEEEVSMKY